MPELFFQLLVKFHLITAFYETTVCTCVYVVQCLLLLLMCVINLMTVR